MHFYKVLSDIARRVYWVTTRKRGRLRHLDRPASRKEYLAMKAESTEDSLLVGGWEVMQDWERPLMRALAKEVTRNHGHVLEVGFGMGISASYIIEFGCSTYTVIEPHPVILQQAHGWAEKQPVPVEIVEGFWEDVIDRLGLFDGILFDTFPTVKEEVNQLVYPFISKASEHLRPGGAFTYYSGAPNTLPEDRLEFLLNHFTEVSMFKLSGLNPPRDCQYYRSSTMIVPVCRK